MISSMHTACRPLQKLQPDERRQLAQRVMAGLDANPRHLPFELIHNAAGHTVAAQLAQIPEYYPIRAEEQIMRRSCSQMAHWLGRRCVLIELGGILPMNHASSLLTEMQQPSAYVCVGPDPTDLLAQAQQIAQTHPSIIVQPVCAETDQVHEINLDHLDAGRRVIYMPGSSISQFEPDDALHLLNRVAGCCEPGGMALISVDLQKSPAIIEPAYNDTRGVMAALNLNALARLNQEFAANFNLECWSHLAVYHPGHHRVEMHLVSLDRQQFTLFDRRYSIDAGQTIRTLHSYKYSFDSFAALAYQAGLEVLRVWTDPDRLMSVQLLQAP